MPTTCNNCGENATYTTDITEAILNISCLVQEVQKLKNIETEYKILQIKIHQINTALSDLGLMDQVTDHIKNDIPF